MKYLLIAFFLFFTINVNGQEESKDFKKLLDEANEKCTLGDYDGALKIYNQLEKEAPENKELNFRMGVCNYYSANYDAAEQNFLKSSSSVSLELFRYKALIAHANMKFKKALNYYNAYKLIAGEKEVSNEEINRLVEKIKYAQQAIQQKRDVLIQNVNAPINSEYQDGVPLISADEEMMMFTSNRSNSKAEFLFDNIYSTSKINNSWQAPIKLRKGINSEKNDVGAGFSADGQTLFLSRILEGKTTTDIYESRMGIAEWEDPVKLGSDINTEYNETSASITLDDKVIYFSSDRPGGLGGKDIYKAIRLPNGKWSKSINLGAPINTPYDEEAPFIHIDKKTLYFSSKGHQNMGGYDVFKTVLKGRDWSTPENLKYPINTVQDDIYYVLSASGKIGYYSSSRKGGQGGKDIYKVVLKDENIQQHVLKAIIKSKGDPLSARIRLIENESKKVKGKYNSNINTGKFIMIVNPEKTYNIMIESEGYNSYSAELDFDINKEEVLEFLLKKK